MSIFRRIRQILSKPEAPIVERSILTVGPGDICEVSLVTYEVIGRTQNQRRSTVVLTLQDGANLQYLVIEDRERTGYSLYHPIDGRLDSIEEVPMTIEKTPFMQGGEQSVWQFQSDDMKLLRVEWLEGRFMLYEGEDILQADVHVIRGN